MNTLYITISCGQAPKKVSTAKGGEYASPCPMCGGEDRFRVWPEQGENGTYWCRGCGKGGDAIQLLRDAKGMGYKEACRCLGLEPETINRLGAPHAPGVRGKDWTPREAPSPAALWRQKAAAFADYAHAELLKSDDQLAWLSGRGITKETAVRFKLGWNPKKLWRKKAAWGLDDDGKKLYLPAGLVIPWSLDGQIHRLRVRQVDGEEPRYLVIKGSGTAAMAVRPAEGEARAWVVVESELDAILVAQEAGDIVGALSLGNSSAKPDESISDALSKATFILVSLDFDAAGAKYWPWWSTHFPQAERWPVPEGKDPGDYKKAGGDIRAWVLAGLPLGLHPALEISKHHIEQLDKKARLPISSFTSAPESPEKKADDIIYDTYRCTVCRKVCDTYAMPGTPPYKGPCGDCLMPPDKPKPERYLDRQNPGYTQGD